MVILIPLSAISDNPQQILFKNILAVKGRAFDIAEIKTYLSNDADTAHIGFAFSDVLGYNVVKQHLEFKEA